MHNKKFAFKFSEDKLILVEVFIYTDSVDDGYNIQIT